MDFSQQDLTTFSPRDRKLIKDNPGKSIYDLTLLGLSAKAAERLKEMEPKLAIPAAKDNVTEKVVPEVTDTPEPEVVAEKPVVTGGSSGPIKPVAVEKVNVSSAPSRVSQPNTPKAGGVWVKNLGTGLSQFMNKEAAERLITKNPTRFKYQ